MKQRSIEMDTNCIVRVKEEQVIIPTYKTFPAEKSPLFIEKRAYQGSTGKVYPLPVTEKISDIKEDVTYKALILENEYLEVMILPELGGRVQRAYDKTNGYDFVYYNHVIKPALVGLTGPWISGGIEFNWPQHHRPSTYMPVDYYYTKNPDGSASVYVGEIDQMYGTKGMAQITLYPDKAYIEIKGQLYNPTDLPQTFLWWANPAVHVNDYTYSVFPPDVNAVMDHGKRAVSTFPIATGEYYKYDYSEGVDISRYKNVKVPTSYMAASSDFDFIGNYDEQVQAGLLHVADHHISPGKKQWTWGNGDFGRTWDKNLTETDGPYIELMTGVFTDNQPDFTWLKPHEEKSFVQYFMPYKGVGRVGNATKEAAVSLAFTEDGAQLKVYATSTYQNATVKLSCGVETIFIEQVDLSPVECFTAEISVPIEPTKCLVTVTAASGQELVKYQVFEKKIKPIPEPAEALKAPAELKSVEELYLAATHLEQYRHATFEPADYYLEGLRRDPSDIRLNNGYGLLLYRRGHIKESIPYFKAAIKKQTWKNPNPYMGESFFNLGLALEKMGEYDKALDAYYKASWSSEMQGLSFYHLACLAARKGEYKEALAFAEKALIRNWHSIKVRHLKAVMLRKLQLECLTFLEESIAIDPLAMGLIYEKAVQEHYFSSWQSKMREPAFNYLELSLNYMQYGLYDEVQFILENCKEKTPMVFYYLGYASAMSGNEERAMQYYYQAEAMAEDYCFPSRLEEMIILEHAITMLNAPAKACYYLANLLYDKKQYAKAITYWEKAIAKKNDFAMCYRNLSIAYFNKQKDSAKAMQAIQKACELEPDYPRFFLEYDQLASRMQYSVLKRLKAFEVKIELVRERDDLWLRYITLLNCTQQYAKALQCLEEHIFHPWEGGEGKVSEQYRYALIALAKQSIQSHDYEKAIALLEKSLTYPDNLGEGKLPNVPDNQTYYYMGIAYQKMLQEELATKYFKLATNGEQTPSSVLYYNDQPSDYIYYQGLAWEKLGQQTLSKKSFHQLISFGERHIFDEVTYDFFAVSLPEIEVYQEDLKTRNVQYCNYLSALGYLGLGEVEKSSILFERLLEMQPDYQGALAQK